MLVQTKGFNQIKGQYKYYLFCIQITIKYNIEWGEATDKNMLLLYFRAFFGVT